MGTPGTRTAPCAPTGAYGTATLTGDLDTLRYLQRLAHIPQFVTNGQTSSFVVNDLLAQGGGELFLTPTVGRRAHPAAGGGDHSDR